MKKQRLGLTLIELVVVVAILGVLAAMLLPKFEGLQTAANHAATAGSASDLSRLIGVYKTSKTVYPDRWDSLLNADGSLVQTTNVGTGVKGLNAELNDGAASGTSASKLSTTTLSTSQVAALQKVGITTLYNATATQMTSTDKTRTGDAFTTAATLGSGTTTTVASINKNTDGGKKIIDHIYRFNKTAAGTTGSINSSPTSPTGDLTTQLIVFGVGPQCTLIPNSMLEAPTYGNANATYTYNRLLVVFELTNPSTGSPAVAFKAVLASDGDLLDDIAVNMQTSKL